MGVAGRRFQPTLWPTLAALALLPLLLGLGRWQLDRAAQKRELVAAFEASRHAAPVPWRTGLPRFTQVEVEGRWDAARQVLLDAAVHEGRSGFRVLAPLVLVDGEVLLVDRGWVPGDPARRALPEVAFVTDAAVVRVRGLTDALPRAGLAAGAAPTAEGWPRVMLYPNRDALNAAYGAPVVDGVLRLDPAAADGFVREFRPDFGVSRERHLAYAVTWFALAATLVAIWFLTHLRPPEGDAR